MSVAKNARLLYSIPEAVDDTLRKEQAGCRRGRGCTDHIFSLWNIIEQCAEWQRQLYINFIDFDKAFDSIHRDSLWWFPRAYGIPHLIIRNFYTKFTCSMDQSDLRFEVKTGVRQGYVISAILFNTVIDWVLRRTTEDEPRGTRWTLFSTLEDVDLIIIIILI